MVEKKGEREGRGGGEKKGGGLSGCFFLPSPVVEKLGIALAGAFMYSRGEWPIGDKDYSLRV